MATTDVLQPTNPGSASETSAIRVYKWHLDLKFLLLVAGVVLLCAGGGISLARHLQKAPVQVSAAKQAPHETAVADPPAKSVSPPNTAKSAPPPAPKAPVTTAPRTPTALPKPATVFTNSLCQVDASQAPDLVGRAQEMAAVCLTVFPQIEALLTPSPYGPPHEVVFDYNPYAAYTQDGVVHVSIDWLRNDTFDPGLLPHELTHVIQNYDGTAPSWLTEGIATYMSYKLGYSIGIAHCNSDETYLSGYGCAASLLNYVERRYKPSIVKDVHLALKADTYTNALFVNETGRNVSQLYNECLKAECKGGTTP